MKQTLLIALALVAVLFLAGWTLQSKPSYEYKFVFDATEKKSNELGTQGWELIAIQSPSGAGLGNNVSTYVYKRQK